MENYFLLGHFLSVTLRVGARDALHIKVTSEKITCADFKHDGQLFEGHLLSRRLEEAGSGASF